MNTPTPTYIQNEHLTRQSDIINYHTLNQKVIIVGAGATGSFTALSLSKMGMNNITVFDNDVVSIENMNNQFYRKKDIGSSKVSSLKNLIFDFTDTNIFIKDRLFDETLTDEELKNLLDNSYLICCADDMNVRKFCLNVALKYGASVYIDPRMGAEIYLQYALYKPIPNQKDVISYEKTLYSNEDAVQTPCTAKSTIYTATAASALIVKTVKNFLMKESYPKIIQWNVKLSENSVLMIKSTNNQNEE